MAGREEGEGEAMAEEEVGGGTLEWQNQWSMFPESCSLRIGT